jgi:hypothetical protein
MLEKGRLTRFWQRGTLGEWVVSQARLDAFEPADLRPDVGGNVMDEWEKVAEIGVDAGMVWSAILATP